MCLDCSKILLFFIIFKIVSLRTLLFSHKEVRKCSISVSSAVCKLPTETSLWPTTVWSPWYR